MILDSQNRFSDSQALTATAASTDSIDLGFDNNVGIGEPMSVVVFLETAADDADADETYSVDLEADSVSGFGSAVVIATRAIPRGTASGEKFVLSVPADLSADQFLRLNYTLGGTTPSVTVSAYLVPTKFVDNSVAYPVGYTIS